MGVDRATAVKKAEDLVREGKPDLAIGEYLRLVEEQPADMGAANALGDLYAKVGNRALAVEQFVQIGNAHRESGFVPKAIAFYKKALKVDPASDRALSQLAQIAVDQELFADATLYLNRLLQRRRELNNDAGVAECLVRLGGFPTATADTKMAAARAAAGHFAAGEASRLWIDAADALERAGRPQEAVDVLFQAVSLDTEDVALRRRVVVACADTGQIERARALLSFETAGDRGDLLMALAQQALGEGRSDEARRALRRVVEVAPEQRADAEALLAPLQPAAAEAESVEITIETDAAPAAGPAADDWGVVTPATSTQPAGDPGWESLLGVDAAPEPSVESEPSVELEPSPEAETEAAPATESEPQAVGDLGWDALLGGDAEAVADEGDGVVTDFPSEVPLPDESSIIAGTSTELEWSALLGDEDATTDTPERSEAAAAFEPAPALELEPQTTSEPEPESEAVIGPAVEPDEYVHEAAPPVASRPDALLVEPLQLSPADASTIEALTAAADNPALQFQASAQLGRLLLRLERPSEGVAWLERAAQATTAVREQRLDVMYELADALERLGEHGRALDVFADLDFDAASYRDVPERMARLRGALEEGRAP